jgi:putative endonuclease
VKRAEEVPYYVYILQSQVDQTYYVGSCADLDERLRRHNEGRSLYTRTKRPWRLVYFEKHVDRSAAVKREAEIKSKKRTTFIESRRLMPMRIYQSPVLRYTKARKDRCRDRRHPGSSKRAGLALS